ncbi:catalase [Ruegeria sp.]|uniref:catalase n=1 Tax=Ruegeria sp. TaxID=1879320 RepID=UPI00231485EA|nr:catalase [Ruegeria sp.]MDA7963579.1 catalase [Ruegeria sp.]
MIRPSLMALCFSVAAFPVVAEDDFDFESGFETFEKLFGVTEGKRRNHTKGFCVEGTLTPLDAAIKDYSNSPLFTGTSSVIARVSHKGGKANPADDTYDLLGLSMQITTPDDDLHVIAMNTEHFFPVSTSGAFIELLQAKVAGGDATKAFAAANPSLKKYSEYHGSLDKTLRPYEGTKYFSVNSFHLVNEAGEETPIRFDFRPSGEEGIVVETHPDFFLENMQANIANGGVSWDMVITLANPDDVIDDPSIQWTGEHTEIVAARFTAEAAMTEADGQCDEINFDPLVLSEGFAPSNDPMLEARSLIYAHGVGQRLSEKE